MQCKYTEELLGTVKIQYLKKKHVSIALLAGKKNFRMNKSRFCECKRQEFNRYFETLLFKKIFYSILKSSLQRLGKAKIAGYMNYYLQ